MKKAEPASGDIRSLTGLRGIAALWVVLYHLDHDSRSGLLGNLVGHGYLAVDIFFVLSGLVMAMSYAGMFRHGFVMRHYLIFLVRRLARVWPLYAAATCFYAALLLAGFSARHFSAAAMAGLLPLNLAMVQSWGLGETIDRPGWSVSTEFAAYLLFPALAWVSVFARRRVAAAAGMVCCLALVLLASLAQSPEAGNGPLDIWRPGTPWPVLRCLSEFGLGLLTYRVLPACRDLCSRTGPAASWALALALLALLATPGTDVLVVLLVPPLLVQLTLLRGGLAGVLGSRPVHFLGVVSYAIYLLHWALLPLQRITVPLRAYLGEDGAWLATLVLFFTTLMVSATLAYRLIERPGRRWLRAFGERRIAQAPEPAAGGLPSSEEERAAAVRAV
jgi:peptidoglycan/LPS O-acetylase OafA/YrhL